jgi:hypothetical protein
VRLSLFFCLTLTACAPQWHNPVAPPGTWVDTPIVYVCEDAPDWAQPGTHALADALSYWGSFGWAVPLRYGPCDDSTIIPAGVVIATLANPPPGQVGIAYRRSQDRAVVLLHEQAPPMAGRAIAHELGHALVSLKHTGPYTWQWGRLMDGSQRWADEWLVMDEDL